MGAEGKGLQVLTKENEWIDAIAGEGELIINMGDMMARLTNNQLKSTLPKWSTRHTRELWGTSRYSVPFFLHPSPNMPLNCLEDCVSEENPKAFEDCTAGEFLDERLRELGLKNKLWRQPSCYSPLPTPLFYWLGFLCLYFPKNSSPKPSLTIPMCLLY